MTTHNDTSPADAAAGGTASESADRPMPRGFETTRQLLKFLQDNPGTGPTQWAEAVGISRAQANNWLKRHSWRLVLDGPDIKPRRYRLRDVPEASDPYAWKLEGGGVLPDRVQGDGQVTMPDGRGEVVAGGVDKLQLGQTLVIVGVRLVGGRVVVDLADAADPAGRVVVTVG